MARCDLPVPVPPTSTALQRECGRREGVGGPARIALPGEDVEDDVGGVDTLGDRLGASGLDRRQPVGEHRGEDVDHLPIAVVDTQTASTGAAQKPQKVPAYSMSEAFLN